jgi:2-polyprenyl-3-methyl-5-hydroxy-6-metoxy-1,4-benzoquinol methylase
MKNIQGISLEYDIYEQNLFPQIPSEDEIAQEWNTNVPSRVKELEANKDFTYLNTIIPGIKDALEKYTNLNDKILDVGCGTGYLTNSIKELGYDIQGIDIADEAIYHAQRRFPNIFFNNTSIIEFSSEHEKEFNVCILNMVLHNLINLDDNICALNKLLKSNGIVIASIPHPDVWVIKEKLDLREVIVIGRSTVYKASFKIHGGSKHPSKFTYVHRKVPTYNHLIISSGFKIINSYPPMIVGNGIDEDLLFCIWKKNDCCSIA